MATKLPQNVALAIAGLAGPYRPDLSASQIIERLTGPAPAPASVVPKGYSITETGLILQVSRRKVYDLIHTGKLPVVTLGHRTKRVPHAALERLLSAPAGQEGIANA